MTKKIKLKYIPKIEGHATLITDLEKGAINQARFKTMEGARLIEGILVGRDYQEAPLITARICGICPVVHNLCSIKAIEDAFKIKVSEKTVILRKLMMLGQFIQSHSLHLYFLTLPDYFKMRNSMELLNNYPNRSKKALAIREFGNKLIEIIGGRSIHPMNSAVGGFLKEPDKNRLKKLLEKVDSLIFIAQKISQIFFSLTYPSLFKKTEYIAISNSGEYAIYDGTLTSTITKNITAKQFVKEVQEQYSKWQLIKKTKFHGKVYMVGSLARINLNQKKLRPKAKELLKKSDILFPSKNSFYNVLAQMVEIVHCLEESKVLIKKYLAVKGTAQVKKYRIKVGVGIGVIEAPRGTLFHIYEIDQYGILKNVNLITPTAQFVNNLEEDIKALLPHVPNLFSPAARRKIKMLVRAYDPCMTCATH